MAAVGAEAHGSNPAVVGPSGENGGGRREKVAAGRKGRRWHQTNRPGALGGAACCVLPQLQQDAALLVVPHDHPGIVGGRGQQRPVWRELAGHHVVVVALQLADQRVLVHVPEQDLQGEEGAVIAAEWAPAAETCHL